MALNPAIAGVTDRIIERSKPTRRRYLELMAEQKERGIDRPRLSCGNFAHGFAGAGADQAAIRDLRGPNIGIVTAYNDMLSAHAPYARYPEQMKIFAREVGATAQVAGGVPAMCDGVTQGQPGMDLSLFSRDVIAMATAVALSHGMFEAVALLGICDKIVPGLADRRAALRSLADASGPGWTDAVGPSEQGEAAHPPALCGRQGRQGRASEGGGGILSQRRDLHLLRHRELQPDDDGADGPARAQCRLHQSRDAASAGADPRCGASSCRPRPKRRASAEPRRG